MTSEEWEKLFNEIIIPHMKANKHLFEEFVAAMTFTKVVDMSELMSQAEIQRTALESMINDLNPAAAINNNINNSNVPFFKTKIELLMWAKSKKPFEKVGRCSVRPTTQKLELALLLEPSLCLWVKEDTSTLYVPGSNETLNSGPTPMWLELIRREFAKMFRFPDWMSFSAAQFLDFAEEYLRS